MNTGTTHGYIESLEAEIERLRAERDLWRSRAERMFWLLPDDVRLSQFAEVNEQNASEPSELAWPIRNDR